MDSKLRCNCNNSENDEIRKECSGQSLRCRVRYVSLKHVTVRYMTEVSRGKERYS